MERELGIRTQWVAERIGNIAVKTGTRVDSLKKILAEGYDAIFVGTGAPRGRDLDVPGRAEAAKNVHLGIDWLASVSFGHIDRIGKRVIVLGGGNTAMDCCRTALRLGAESVTVTVRSPRKVMKASDWEIKDAVHEGIPILDNHAPKSFVIEGGKAENAIAVGPLKIFLQKVYDSRIFGASTVYATRKALGRQLAKESAVPADVVIPVPDSGVPAALGYAEGAGIPFETGLIRNHYVGRTFIEPEQSIRHFGVKVKLNAVPEVLEGKRVVVVDDSLVRGTTSRKIVKMIRQAGAKEVHMRISSPPILSPCFYGIDTPTKKELIASDHSIEEIRKYITADSLAYLSIDGMLNSAPLTPDQYCTACFTERYPIPFTRAEELQLGLFEPTR